MAMKVKYQLVLWYRSARAIEYEPSYIYVQNHPVKKVKRKQAVCATLRLYITINTNVQVSCTTSKIRQHTEAAHHMPISPSSVEAVGVVLVLVMPGPSETRLDEHHPIL